MASGEPALSLRGATLRYAERTLWQDLDLDVSPGELVAVLGPNGAGKTSLIRVLLGLTDLTSGTVTVAGRTPQRGRAEVGYVPQQKGFDRDLALRGCDLVRLGLDGHRWGPRRLTRRDQARISAALAAVGAERYAGSPVGSLSGGEQQRLRIAQALVREPGLLLCDEPLLSLDLRHQEAVVSLIDEVRRRRRAAVLLVTHEINPVLPYVDRVVYLVGGRWAAGTPEEVMTSERLSELYGSRVDVLRVRDRLIVVGAPDVMPGGTDAGADGGHHHLEHHHHELGAASGLGAPWA